MAITNGQLADADEVKQMNSLQYSNIAQLVYNADYIGFDADNQMTGIPNWRNLNYSVVDATADFSSSLGIPTLGINNYNVFYLSQGKFLYSGIVYDYLEGTTPSGTNWTDVGSDPITFSQADNQWIKANGPGGSNVTNDITMSAALLDLEPASGDVAEAIFRCKIDAAKTGSGTPTYAREINLVDGSANSVALDNDTTGGSRDKIYNLIFSTNNVEVRDITSAYPGSLIGNVDTSSLVGSVWHLEFRCAIIYSGGVVSPDPEIEVGPLVYVRNSTEASASKYEAETTAITHTGNIGEAFLTYNVQDETLASASFSANNGSNYDTIANNGFAETSNDGTQLMFKFDFSGTNDRIPKLTEYAGFYDTW